MAQLVDLRKLMKNGGLYTWYIEGPKEKILVDTGADLEALPPQPWRFPDVSMEKIQTLEEGLAKVGLKPADIDIVIVTHMHEDHVMLAREYPNARLIVQKAELEFARNPHPVQAFSYLKDPFDDVNWEVIEGDREIVEGVRVVLTPGHCPGAQSVVVDTAKGRAVISGFCCVEANFHPPMDLDMAVLPTGIVLDTIESYESVLKVKGLADILIPVHSDAFIEVDSIP
jgi:glyoxylase-like metal-dependent hydrolase (beta-lactamase superfamily II)